MPQTRGERRGQFQRSLAPIPSIKRQGVTRALMFSDKSRLVPNAKAISLLITPSVAIPSSARHQAFQMLLCTGERAADRHCRIVEVGDPRYEHDEFTGLLSPGPR